MEAILIAPCGANCSVCSSYLAMKNGLKKTGIMTRYCRGCGPRGKGCGFTRMGCELLINQRVRFCFECEEFPCYRNKETDERYRNRFHVSLLENLYFIKENGVEKFLEKEEEKWKCPECGGVISCHNGICYSCGLEKLRNKEKKHRWEGDQ